MNIGDRPDTETMIADLEATRAAYHALLAQIPADAWRRRSGNPDMLVKQLMWHMAWAMGWLARGVAGTRSGRRSLVGRLPGPIADPARKLAMRALARTATPERAGRAYDDGHAALIAELSKVAGTEWQLATVRFGEERTVAWHFRQPVDHFAEHAADIVAVL